MFGGNFGGNLLERANISHSLGITYGVNSTPVGTPLYRLRVLGQWFDGIRFYAAASSPRRSRRTWAGLR